MGLDRDLPVVIVGVGNLGHALANYAGLTGRGFCVVGLVDADQAVVGDVIAGLPVRAIDELEAIVGVYPGCIGVLAVPASAAQQVTDRLVGAGVRSILTFAPISLTVPDGVQVRKVDLGVELQILAYHERARASEAVAG